jgi:hypothetical protein
MRINCFLVGFILLLCLCRNASAQQQAGQLVTMEASEISFKQLVNELQKRSGLKIYYDTSYNDSLKYTVSVNNKPLLQVLKETLPAIYEVAEDYRQQIFITKGAAVKTKLPDNFFIPKPSTVISQVSDTIAIEARTDNPRLILANLQNKLIEIGDRRSPADATTVQLAGTIRDIQTGEPVAGATLFTTKGGKASVSDEYGYYSIPLTKGRHTIYIESLGMKDTYRQVMVYAQGKLDIDMQSEVKTLRSVLVTTSKSGNVTNTQMGVQRINIQSIRQVPVAFGEADLLRVVLTLPGVKSVGEASTGLNVRGGSADQNLILFNDATIYNPSHFFGLFSAFNPEVVKDVELYKSSIPARYGGRLSSVLEINGREGNKKQLTGSAGIGLLTSRLQLEGPIKKDRSSFIVGGRTTYANWLMNLLPDEYENSRASFYDVNLHISHEVNKQNSVYLTGYLSKDRFNLNSKNLYGYANKNISAKWKHIFNNKFNGVLSTGLDRYEYEIFNNDQPLAAFRQRFDINQRYLKAHFNYYHNSSHTIDFGAQTLQYKIHPGNYTPSGEESLVLPDELAGEQALESAFYIADRYNISRKFSVDAGIRYALFNYLGPQRINNYAPGLPRIVNNIIDSTFHGKGKFIQAYKGPELRLSVRYSLSDSSSIKAGVNSQRQYIHMLSNTTAMSPTDIWKLSDPNIKPQYGEQVSIGYYRNFKSNTIEASLELYYKRMQDFLDYKSGAVLLMNHHIETDVISTKGKAYGIEVLIRKTSGKLNGWISYTYSRTLLKADDPNAGEVINGGKYYPANYDKPHDVTAIGNYRFSHRFSVSLNATYSTGRPITLPAGRYYYMGAERSYYTDRNAYRVPDYFRADLSMNIEGNHRLAQKTHNSWTIGVYNLTGRRNAYSVYYVSEAGRVNGYKLSIFGSAIPYVNFNIRF